MTFYVYVDWTTELVPRPFYVGKGSGGRFKRERRNWKHRQTRKQFGITREILFQSSVEPAAFTHEEDVIRELHTFVDDPSYNGLGCNFTAGGDGGKHPSLNTRRLIGESNRRRRGEKRSPAACKRISVAIRASLERTGKRKLSERHRSSISNGLVGHAVSEETREKLRIAAKLQHARAARARGES